MRIFRRTRRTQPDTGMSRDLWWIRIILNVGRPVVAVFVLVMCAPGEHYLAREAGWENWLAWGMPGTLTAYAGIAAVVATKRPKGSEGKRTAVAGAVVSIALAMAAQPIAHLYGRPGLALQQIVLISVISCIPALVFGHLLHMAATPDVRRTPVSVSEDRTAGQSPIERTADSNTGQDVSAPVPVSRTAGQSATARTADSGTGQDSRTPASPGQPDTDIAWKINPKPVVRRISDGTNVSALARDLLSADPDMSDDALRTAIRDTLGQTAKADSIRKAITRARRTA